MPQANDRWQNQLFSREGDLKHLVMGKGSPDRGRGNNEMQLRMFISNKNVLNVRVDEDALRLKALPWGRQTVQP
jgi:hypothetical protein